MEENKEHVSFHAIHIPVGTVVALALWLVGSTFWVTYQMYGVQSLISELRHETQNLGAGLSVRISSLEKDNTIKAVTDWTRANQELWCSRTEQKNPGWMCGDLPSIGTTPGSMDFWKQGTLKTDKPTIEN